MHALPDSVCRCAARAVGLLGGTFDPVHAGHLALAQAALQAMPLARIEFVLAPAPWQKSVLTSVADRADLLAEALAGNPRMQLNLTETLRTGPTYTIETVRSLRTRLGSGTPLVLLLGADQWLRFDTWQCWSGLLDYCSLAVCNRDGTPVATTPQVQAWAQPHCVAPDRIADRPHGLVCTFAMPAHSASSSRIRAVLAGQPRQQALRTLEGWLPVAVSRTIARKNLYGLAADTPAAPRKADTALLL